MRRFSPVVINPDYTFLPLFSGTRMPERVVPLACYSTVLTAALLAGCQGGWWNHGPIDAPDPTLPGPAPPIQNPLFVPHASASSHEFVWDQIVDTVDDYFRIDEEQRTRLVDGVWIGGRIKTFPEPGSTLLEPWRRDSAAGFEKLYATLQSVRRHANIQVTPDQQGMLINVVVYKELEMLDRPEHATVGTSTRRHNDTLTNDRFDVDAPFTDPDFAGWIALGRDAQLEARIIEQIHGRIFAR